MEDEEFAEIFPHELKLFYGLKQEEECTKEHIEIYKNELLLNQAFQEVKAPVTEMNIKLYLRILKINLRNAVNLKNFNLEIKLGSIFIKKTINLEEDHDLIIDIPYIEKFEMNFSASDQDNNNIYEFSICSSKLLEEFDYVFLKKDSNENINIKIKTFKILQSKKVIKNPFTKKLLIGHRGSGSDKYNCNKFYIRENTIESFQLALENGLKWVEFDVHITKDKVPVVFHDFCVKRGNQKIPIYSLTKDEFFEIMNPIEITQMKGRYCTLEQLLVEFENSLGFNIEIKYPLNREIEEMNLINIPSIETWVNSILNVIEKFDKSDMIFSSFHPDVCLFLKLKLENSDIFFISEAGLKFHDDKRCNSFFEATLFCMKYKLRGVVVDSRILLMGFPGTLKIFKKSGLLLLVYGEGTNSLNLAMNMWEEKVDGLITDNVKEVISLSNKEF